MSDDASRSVASHGREEPEQVFVDDLLVEAARAGWLRDDAPDPVAQVLATLHDCALGRCACASRDRCPIRAAGGA